MQITPLKASDRADWEVLARGYKEFYKTPTSAAEFDAAWSRIIDPDGIYGLAARLDGEFVGIAHYLFHGSTWTTRACYLQDLYTIPAARGKGVATALINAVGEAARAQGATRYYWLTAQDNATARRLYDKVARFHGFIRYDVALDG